MSKFEIYQDKAGYYRWRLVAGNGEIVAISEGYATRFNAQRSITSVKQLASIAYVV